MTSRHVKRGDQKVSASIEDASVKLVFKEHGRTEKFKFNMMREKHIIDCICLCVFPSQFLDCKHTWYFAHSLLETVYNHARRYAPLALIRQLDCTYGIVTPVLQISTLNGFIISNDKITVTFDDSIGGGRMSFVRHDSYSVYMPRMTSEDLYKFANGDIVHCAALATQNAIQLENEVISYWSGGLHVLHFNIGDIMTTALKIMIVRYLILHT